MVPTLVLLPGMDGTGEHFAPLISAFGELLPTIVVRYPNEPLAYAQYELIARAALPQDRPFVLLGESFSGPISIAAEPPIGLVAYVLCASFANCPRLILRLLQPLLGVIPSHRMPNALASYLLMGRFATPDLRRANAATLQRISPRTLTSRLKAVAAVDVSKKLEAIKVPGLYLRPTEDRLVPAAVCHALARNAPNVRVVEIEGPHFLLQVNPHAAANAIGDFVRSLELHPPQVASQRERQAAYIVYGRSLSTED